MIREEASNDRTVAAWRLKSLRIPYLYTPGQVRGRVQYIEENPGKHGLSPRSWPLVRLYDGWPLKR
jgi:hypothetical protein